MMYEKIFEIFQRFNFINKYINIYISNLTAINLIPEKV